MDASTLQWIIPIAGIAAVLFALYLARDVLARDQGTAAMQDVAGELGGYGGGLWRKRFLLDLEQRHSGLFAAG